jgi:hypothetical protein
MSYLVECQHRAARGLGDALHSILSGAQRLQKSGAKAG